MVHVESGGPGESPRGPGTPSYWEVGARLRSPRPTKSPREAEAASPRSTCSIRIQKQEGEPEDEAPAAICRNVAPLPPPPPARRGGSSGRQALSGPRPPRQRERGSGRRRRRREARDPPGGLSARAPTFRRFALLAAGDAVRPAEKQQRKQDGLAAAQGLAPSFSRRVCTAASPVAPLRRLVPGNAAPSRSPVLFEKGRRQQQQPGSRVRLLRRPSPERGSSPPALLPSSALFPRRGAAGSGPSARPPARLPPPPLGPFPPSGAPPSWPGRGAPGLAARPPLSRQPPWSRRQRPAGSLQRRFRLPSRPHIPEAPREEEKREDSALAQGLPRTSVLGRLEKA
ncbi:uncharacterized protein LOC114606115 [Podarcis muralis]